MGDPPHIHGLIRYPFPLSDGTHGYVYLPRTVTAEDARRLSAMVDALVMEPAELEGTSG